MGLKLFDDPSRLDQKPSAHDERQDEGVVWLPRSRLRSGGRGDRAVIGLTLFTAATLAAAAGVAAWTRHGDLPDAGVTVMDKASERAPAARAVATEAAAIRAAQRAPAPPPPSQKQETAAIERASEPALPTVSATSKETMPDAPAGAPAATSAPLKQSATNVVPVAPLQQEQVAEPVPPIPLSSALAAPVRSASAAGVDAPLWPAPSGQSAPKSASLSPSLPSVAPESAQAGPATVDREEPERQRAAALSPPPAGGGAKVSVYLDEFPDQKAAATGLSQKSGAYGRIIGSTGKLTYTRRNGDSWRLRVGNLDRATADALCAKLKSAGAPCTLGPN